MDDFSRRIYIVEDRVSQERFLVLSDAASNAVHTVAQDTHREATTFEVGFLGTFDPGSTGLGMTFNRGAIIMRGV